MLSYLLYFWKCIVLAIFGLFGSDLKPEMLKCKKCGKSIELNSKLKVLAYFLDCIFVLWVASSPVWLFQYLKSELLAFVIVFSVATAIILLDLLLYVYFYKTNKWQLKEDEHSIPT